MILAEGLFSEFQFGPSLQGLHIMIYGCIMKYKTIVFFTSLQPQYQLVTALMNNRLY